MVETALAMLVMSMSGSLVGLGAVAAALAGPNQLVIVAMMLLMIAAAYRSPFDLDL